MSEPVNSHTGNQKGSFLHIYLGCGLLMVVVLLLDHAFPRGVAIDVLYITPVLLSLRAKGNRPAIVTAIVCSLLIVVGYFLSSPGGEQWKVLFNRFIAVAGVWITVTIGLRNKELEAVREVAVREREKALEEMKTLSGLLPICAWCKKVRNDQGYWTQIEAYIAAHSEASFSHGICPECMEKHYPEVSRKKKSGRTEDETP